jgi:hypothetical protein
MNRCSVLTACQSASSWNRNNSHHCSTAKVSSKTSSRSSGRFDLHQLSIHLNLSRNALTRTPDSRLCRVTCFLLSKQEQICLCTAINEGHLWSCKLKGTIRMGEVVSSASDIFSELLKATQKSRSTSTSSTRGWR